jgi:hypothetical protein
VLLAFSKVVSIAKSQKPTGKCNMQVAISLLDCGVKVGNKNKTAKCWRKKARNLIISQKKAKFASPYFKLYVYSGVWGKRKDY